MDDNDKDLMQWADDGGPVVDDTQVTHKPVYQNIVAWNQEDADTANRRYAQHPDMYEARAREAIEEETGG